MAGFTGDDLDLEFGEVSSVDIAVIGGDVAVTAGDGPVRITGKVLTGEPIEVHLEHGTLRINHNANRRVIDHVLAGGSPEAHITVVAPAAVAVKVRVVTADVLVAGFDTAPGVATVSGAITASELGGITATTVSGSIEAQSLLGTVTANAVSGPITIMGGRLTSTQLKTASGAVHLDAESLGDSSITTVSGALAIRLAEEAGADFEATTVSGRLDCAFPLADGVSTKRKLSGAIGGGGPRLKVTTVSGAVAVVRKRMATL